ncbi:ras GEF [Thelephora terrestris]|uniref:Ras GEF n=1 Tax=Thelephora terrestris TaxID=56493 RepID=A0A9P6HF43_9AGAM|nr:ras GEF [Thelephora terrestris]
MEDRQSSGGDESIVTSVSSTSFNPTEQSTSTLFLPLPNPSTNKSRSSFVLSDDELPPEIANADISIARDGSFVETSSGAAARELKKRYDERLGVGSPAKGSYAISPYAITAFVNQHGKQMYRVGHRELSPPALSSEDAFMPPRSSQSTGTTKSSSSSGPTKRRSRMSMHTFLPPTIFKSSHPNIPPGLGHSPQSGNDSTNAFPNRRLRKARSLSNMFGMANAQNPHIGAVPSNPPPQIVQGPSISNHAVGRPHAHSVTGADIPRQTLHHSETVTTVTNGLASMDSISSRIQKSFPPPPTRDVFSDIMGWNAETLSETSSFDDSSSSHNQGGYRPHQGSGIKNPFGRGVHFDPPVMRERIRGYRYTDHLKVNDGPVIREMQSFESGLTARADPISRQSIGGKGKERRRLSVKTSKPILESEAEADPTISPSLETSSHSRYSTQVFDVLQLYRGLPLLDKLSEDAECPETTVIRLSARNELSAAPKDDPRFVMWGEVWNGFGPNEEDGTSVDVNASVASLVTSTHTLPTRPANSKAEGLPPVSRVQPSTSSHLGLSSNGESPRKVVIAATIERWIAQLTSELNYDELLIFFLTYRTYVSAVDLCHLLICRFHWALESSASAPPSAAESDAMDNNDMVKRIVRVRTFIAIRYWLLTFFAIDFVPNRELRVLFGNWLNTLAKDPTLHGKKDIMDIVRKLKKVAKDCINIQTSKPRSSGLPQSRTSTSRRATNQQSRKSGPPGGTDGDSDVDLDFLPDSGAASVNHPQSFGATGKGPGISPSSAADAAILQQPLHLAILSHTQPPDLVNSPSSATLRPHNGIFVPSPSTLPFHHKPLSRAFANTIGRLGRWKRVLNHRSAPGPGGSSQLQVAQADSLDVSPFNLEPNVTGDLLMVKGGMEQYLKMIDQQSHASSTTSSVHSSSVRSSSHPSSPNMISPSISLPGTPGTPLRPDSRPASPESYDSEKSRRQAHESLLSGPQPDSPASSPPPPNIPGPSSGRGLTKGGYQHRFQHDSYWDIPENGQDPDGRWQIDVVSIDELDLSDMSSSEDDSNAGKLGAGPSDPGGPPGLRRLPKKLPMRRDFQFVRPESVSSFGAAGAHTSVISAVYTTASGAEDEEHPRLGRGIQQWQVNAIVDSLTDDEEAGDVDAALNRLEGRINQTQQMVKQSKVETWVKSIRERMVNGLYGEEKPRFPMDDSDEDEGSSEVDEFGVVKSLPVNLPEKNPSQRMSLDTKRASQSSSANEGLSPEVETPVAQTHASKATVDATRSGPGSPKMGSDSIQALDDAVPMEILQSRVASRPCPPSGAGLPSPASGGIRPLHPTTFVPPNKPYRSFVLTVRAGPLAEHLAIIERELFIGLKFEELVVDDWRNSVEESNVLDWAQFLKERARYKAEGRITAKTSALVAFRGRFNLFAKFVASEIVMTLPNERLNLVSKFIRVAWKLYERGAFNTLISLLAGLQSSWVTRAVGKRWEKLGSSEARVYRDLRLVTGAAGDFRYLRQEVEAAIEAEPISVNPRDSSAIGADASPMGKGKGEGKIQPRTTCIPFLGQYLSQLHRHCQLPDLIDPTSPNEPVCIDPETNAFEPPAHPEVFAALAPLPPSMQLEPLINIQKQRRIAGVIKSLVTGQHLASKLRFPIDKKLFQRCLRLKALDEDILYRVYAMYAD